MQGIAGLRGAKTILLMALAWGTAQPAAAAASGAAQALQIITRAWAAEKHCRLLDTAEHDELSGYASRAETAAGQQFSASITDAAIAAGKAEGDALPCNDGTRSDIAHTLAAARQAARRADASNPPAAPQAPAPDPAAAPAEPRHIVGPTDYAGELGPYYLERKCKMLSPNQDDRYWRAITRMHMAVVQQNGIGTAHALMHRAEVSAASRDCDDAALLKIKAGFASAMTY